MSRTKGALSKLRRTVLQACEERGVSPVEIMLDYTNHPELGFAATKELMQYCYPKLKAMEFTLKDLPDEVFDQEVQRRIHLKILNGEKVG